MSGMQYKCSLLLASGALYPVAYRFFRLLVFIFFEKYSTLFTSSAVVQNRRANGHKYNFLLKYIVQFPA
jgi:hypothetical protein